MGKNIEKPYERLATIRVRLNEIHDACERENRPQTDAEVAEVKELSREAHDINLRLAVANIPTRQTSLSREVGFDNYIKGVKESGKITDRVMAREVITTADIAGQIPLTIGDVIKPLEEGLILNKVGLTLKTGLVGEYVSPVINRVQATIEGEAVKLGDTKIATSAVRPKPFRLGISTKTTYSAVNRSAGLTLAIVNEQLPQGVIRTLNAAMFSPVKLTYTQSGEAVPAEAVGPFVKILTDAPTGTALSAIKSKAQKKSVAHIQFAGATPTFKELMAMKGLVMAKGVENDGTAAFVMSAYMMAELEATPRDAGSGLMVVENGRIGGIPVFCTNDIDAGDKSYVGFGIWSNELLGQFGDMRYIVDPVSCADEDSIKHTLNAEWAMTTYRQEAFVLGSFAE
jgi:hypothetical protein